jgi:hypothetical protein
VDRLSVIIAGGATLSAALGLGDKTPYAILSP